MWATEHFAASLRNSSFISPSLSSSARGLGVRFEVSCAPGRARNPSLVASALASLSLRPTELISGWAEGGGGDGAVIDQAAVAKDVLQTATEALGSGGVGEHHLSRSHRPRPRGGHRARRGQHAHGSSTGLSRAGFAPPTLAKLRFFADRHPAGGNSTASTSSTSTSSLLAMSANFDATPVTRLHLAGNRPAWVVDLRGPSISRLAAILADVGIEGGHSPIEGPRSS